MYIYLGIGTHRQTYIHTKLEGQSGDGGNLHGSQPHYKSSQTQFIAAGCLGLIAPRLLPHSLSRRRVARAVSLRLSPNITIPMHISSVRPATPPCPPPAPFPLPFPISLFPFSFPLSALLPYFPSSSAPFPLALRLPLCFSLRLFFSPYFPSPFPRFSSPLP